MMKRRAIPTLVACAVLTTVGASHALEMRPHLEGSAAHFVGVGGAWQAREIGPGMVGSGALELALSRRIGIEGRLFAGRFLQGSPSADPSIRHVDQAGFFGVTAGLRIRPIWEDRGLWIGGAAGNTQTGGLSRLLFDARVGWDFKLGGSLLGGPFVGYLHVVQPSSSLRPEDGRVGMLGIHVAFDDYDPKPATPGDTQLAPRPAPKPVVAKAAPKPKAPAKKPAQKPAPVVVEEPTPMPEVAPAEAEISVATHEIVLSDRLYFELNSASIKSESRLLLESVAKVILAHPELESIEIQGHTDDLGTDEWNRKLSVSRALAVRKVLIDCGVSPDRLTTKGFGKSTPIAFGMDEASRQLNRRVEFVIQRRTFQ